MQIAFRDVGSTLYSIGFTCLPSSPNNFIFSPLKAHSKWKLPLSASSLCSLFSWKCNFLSREFISLVSHPLGPIHDCPPWVTTELGSGLLVPCWEEGKWTGKPLGGQKLSTPVCALHDKWRKEQREEQWPQTKAGIVWEMDPFQKPSKPPFHKAWQGYSIEPGWQPSMALIYYCQTVCCLYLPRLTNWTFVGLAAPAENWSYCYWLHESFHGMCQNLTQHVADFPSLFSCSFFFFIQAVVVLFLFCLFNSSSE